MIEVDIAAPRRFLKYVMRLLRAALVILTFTILAQTSSCAEEDIPLMEASLRELLGFDQHGKNPKGTGQHSEKDDLTNEAFDYFRDMFADDAYRYFPDVFAEAPVVWVALERTDEDYHRFRFDRSTGTVTAVDIIPKGNRILSAKGRIDDSGKMIGILYIDEGWIITYLAPSSGQPPRWQTHEPLRRILAFIYSDSRDIRHKEDRSELKKCRQSFAEHVRRGKVIVSASYRYDRDPPYPVFQYDVKDQSLILISTWDKRDEDVRFQVGNGEAALDYETWGNTHTLRFQLGFGGEMSMYMFPAFPL